MELVERDTRMELRSALRYQLAAPVVFKWESATGGVLQGDGVTRDISVSGAFILTASPPPPGITLSVEIFLGHYQSSGHSMRMITEGRVVRVEHPVLGESRHGFAVAGEGFAIPEIANNN